MRSTFTLASRLLVPRVTVLGRFLGSLALSSGLVACAGQRPTLDAGSSFAAGVGGTAVPQPFPSASAGAAAIAESWGGASGSHVAGKSGSGPDALRAPMLPLLPHPAEPFDPDAWRSLRQRLSRMAARVAPGARAAGDDIVGKLGPGQRLERSYVVGKGCYTAVAIAEAGGIVDLGLELVNEASPDEVHVDAGKADTAVVAQPPACLRLNAEGELRLVITAVSGTGLVAAQLCGR